MTPTNKKITDLLDSANVRYTGLGRRPITCRYDASLNAFLLFNRLSPSSVEVMYPFESPLNRIATSLGEASVDGFPYDTSRFTTTRSCDTYKQIGTMLVLLNKKGHMLLHRARTVRRLDALIFADYTLIEFQTPREMACYLFGLVQADNHKAQADRVRNEMQTTEDYARAHPAYINLDIPSVPHA